MILLSLGLLSTNSKRVKITFFYVEKAALKKKMVGMNKNVYFKNIYWGVYMSCIQEDAILNSSSIPCFTYLYMRQV